MQSGEIDMGTLTTVTGRFFLLLALTFLGGGIALAYDLPGIPASGAPVFGNDVKIVLNPNSGKLKITGKKFFAFDNGQEIFQGNSSKYTLLVNFNRRTGDFEDGSLKFKGGIDALGIKKSEMLVTADIVNWNLNGTQSGDPLPDGGFDLWGFATSNIVCSPLLLVQCTKNESIYIELDQPFGGQPFPDNLKKFKTTGFAITTVPVPAAAWLFGSALGLLAWLRRRGGQHRSA
jgi:hypothetical protein